jgi:hypothetical protein
LQETLLVDKSPQVVIDLKLVDFLNFFQTYKSSCLNIQMTCPVFRVLLLSISINLNTSIKFSVNVQVSLRLSEVLI